MANDIHQIGYRAIEKHERLPDEPGCVETDPLYITECPRCDRCHVAMDYRNIGQDWLCRECNIKENHDG